MKTIKNLSSHGFSSKPIGIFFIAFLFLFILPIHSFATNYYGVDGATNVKTATFTCWGTNSDGSGTRPTTFTNAADKFIIPVGCTMTLSGSFTLDGATLEVSGTLIDATFTVKGTGAYILKAGATLKTSNPNGVNTIQTTTKLLMQVPIMSLMVQQLKLQIILLQPIISLLAIPEELYL